MLCWRDGPRLQPRLKRSAFQAAGHLDLPGRARNSCEQVPAYYTSMRHSANRRETVWAMDWRQIPARARAARRATHSLAKGTEAARPLRWVAMDIQWPGRTIHWGPVGPRCGLLPAGSSHTPPRRPRAKTGQSSSWGYVWSSGPEASWGTWVSTSGCLTQCTQGRAHVEDLTVLGSSLWLLEPIVASRTAARR